MKRLDTSEIVFKILSYVLLTLFGLACVYPLIYVLAVALSDIDAVSAGKVIIIPLVKGSEEGTYRFGFKFQAFWDVLCDKKFWLAYCNTIFFTFYGTLVSMIIAITGAYALSKTRLLWGRGFNFLLTFLQQNLFRFCHILPLRIFQDLLCSLHLLPLSFLHPGRYFVQISGYPQSLLRQFQNQ